MSEMHLTASAVLDRFRKALVRIKVTGKNAEGRQAAVRVGTGVVVGEKGLILTAKHVVGGNDEWQETAPNSRVLSRYVEVFGSDDNGVKINLGGASVELIPEHDLALLHVGPKTLTVAKLAQLTPDETVAVVALLGKPAGVPVPVLTNLVPTDRPKHGIMLTVQVHVEEGDSGSGLFDANFCLTGIVTNNLDDHQALAVPTSLIKHLVDARQTASGPLTVATIAQNQPAQPPVPHPSPLAQMEANGIATPTPDAKFETPVSSVSVTTKDDVHSSESLDNLDTAFQALLKIVESATPLVALGAIFGASRDPKYHSFELVLTDRLKDALGVFVDARAVAPERLFDEGGLVDWDVWSRRLKLQQMSPFARLTEVNQPLSEALDNALVLAITKNHLDEYVELGDLLIEIRELQRFGGDMRVVLVSVAEKMTDAAMKHRYIARFVRDPEQREQRDRASKESQIIQGLRNIPAAPIRHPITMSAYSVNPEVGSLYELYDNMAVRRIDTLDDALVAAFSNDAGVRVATHFLLSVIEKVVATGGTKFFGKPNDKAVYSWNSFPHPGDKEVEELKKKIALTPSRISPGISKTNSLYREYAAISQFLKDLDGRANIPKNEVFIRSIHGDLHQKNIFVSEDSVGQIQAQVIDFDKASISGHCLADAATFLVSLTVFFYLRNLTFERATSIIELAECKLFARDHGDLTCFSHRFVGIGDICDIAFAHSELSEFEKSYLACVILVLQKVKAHTLSAYGSEATVGRHFRMQLRQLYVAMFLKTVRLLGVSFAPRASVLQFGAWLADHVERDPDLQDG